MRILRSSHRYLTAVIAIIAPLIVFTAMPVQKAQAFTTPPPTDCGSIPYATATGFNNPQTWETWIDWSFFPSQFKSWLLAGNPAVFYRIKHSSSNFFYYMFYISQVPVDADEFVRMTYSGNYRLEVKAPFAYKEYVSGLSYDISTYSNAVQYDNSSDWVTGVRSDNTQTMCILAIANDTTLPATSAYTTAGGTAITDTLDIFYDLPPDVCTNIEGLQSTVPDGYETLETNICTVVATGGGDGISTEDGIKLISFTLATGFGALLVREFRWRGTS